MNTDHSRWDSGPAETGAENGSWRVKENLKGRLFIRGVSSHSNARDIKYQRKQHDCSVVSREGRVVFGHIYTWDISLVMVENQCITGT